MVSHAASTVLFPRVVAEKEKDRPKKFTPLVARTVLWTTVLEALLLALFSRWLMLVLYSEAFLPAVSALQALLVGIVALSAGRVLSNEIAGRGYPNLNTYRGVVIVATNVVFNLLMDPVLWDCRYGLDLDGLIYNFTFKRSLLLLPAFRQPLDQGRVPSTGRLGAIFSR